MEKRVTKHETNTSLSQHEQGKLTNKENGNTEKHPPKSKTYIV